MIADAPGRKQKTEFKEAGHLAFIPSGGTERRAAILSGASCVKPTLSRNYCRQWVRDAAL